MVSLLLSDHCVVVTFTYRSLGVKGNGDLPARLGLLGGASIVNDRLVVLVFALKIVSFSCSSFSDKRHEHIRGRSSWRFRVSVAEALR